MELIEQAKLCKKASYQLSKADSELKSKALKAIADNLEFEKMAILKANARDIGLAKENGKPDSFIDRLTLTDARYQGMIDGVKQVATLSDPCHVILDDWYRNDLHLRKISVPIGVIGIIFEARPNVTVDAASLCLKAGNVCFLRGSKDTINSNKALVHSMQEALKTVGLSENCIELLEDTSHETADKFMQLNGYMDLLIPRGGAGLIRNAVAKATVPIIETGTGNCHIYVDETADFDAAIKIILNSKVQRISVCNAAESLLVHESIAKDFIPLVNKALREYNVKIHGSKAIKDIDDSVILATDEDYGKEYLDYEISIKTVNNIDEAIAHINKYSTHHSEAICSKDQSHIDQFLEEIDSACVYANASTRFSDGFMFGFGAEIGISTQKIHARGPMGLNALTSYKYQVTGKNTIRE